jgi:2-polyprenyl-6-methoxyphenol hydroxylase-like FAD-dependent oxidoreductase
LRQSGADAVVFERAHAQREVGAGISLWANALTCLRTLNLERQVIACGSPIVAGTFRTSDGRVLLGVPLQAGRTVRAIAGQVTRELSGGELGTRDGEWLGRRLPA